MTTLTTVFRDLVRVEIHLWNDIEARLRAEVGITLTFYEFLTVMSEAGSCRVADLADDLSITPSGTSRIVDRMERDGLVRRLPNAGDRRSSLVAMTPHGQQKHSEATVVVEDALAELVASHLSAPSVSALADALRRLSTRLPIA